MRNENKIIRKTKTHVKKKRTCGYYAATDNKPPRHWDVDAVLSMTAVYVFMCTMQRMFVCMWLSRTRRSCVGLSWGITGTNAVGHDVWLQSKACGPKVSIAYLDCLRYFAKDRVYSLPCESSGGVHGRWLDRRDRCTEHSVVIASVVVVHFVSVF